MEESIFNPAPMGLREWMLAPPLENRFSYDPNLNVLFINFERLRVRRERDVARIREAVEKRIKPLRRKAYAIVNYTKCVIEPA
jgi:hypothetical protein